MKLLIDMNLSPSWQVLLQRNGFEALRWFTVGDPDAPEVRILPLQTNPSTLP